MKRLLVAFVIVISFLIGCSADIEDFKEADLRFNLFDFFTGETQAWGMVQDYSGLQTRRFDVDIVGKVAGDTLTLVEDFQFSDGEVSERIWVIKAIGNGEYQGTADDVIGIAKGREVGNALQWEYEMDLQVDGEHYRVTFEDWMYRQDSHHMFNVAEIKKFGIGVGKVTLFFTKK
ncbi:DUF3833 domain-containing protein [Vibrio sp. FNV 38]|nr:DUF3833 domain-containing protein [Vibrio sp. FNV 38]